MNRAFAYAAPIVMAISVAFSPAAFAANDNHQTIEKKIEPIFTDINNDYWAKNEILRLVDKGWMEGYRDLQFRPATPITAGDAAQTFYKAMDLPITNIDSVYDDIDVKDHQLKNAVHATVAAGILHARSRSTFGVDDPLTVEQLAAALTKAFDVEVTKEDIVKMNPARMDFLRPARLSKLPTPAQEFVQDKLPVDRATFAVILSKSLEEKGFISNQKDYVLSESIASESFKPVQSSVDLMKVSFDEHPIYLRSTDTIHFENHERIDYGFSRDNIYTYSVGEQGASIELTVRSFDNGDYFLFSKLENPSAKPVQLDVLQKENFVASYELYRFDKNEIKRNNEDFFNADMTSYPTGVLRFINEDGTIQERMVGQSYRSQQLSMEYAHGGHSQMRELLKEEEALSFTKVGSTFMSVHALQSTGKDIVDQWYLNSQNLLFENDQHREDWMLESAQYYKKRMYSCFIILLEK